MKHPSIDFSNCEDELDIQFKIYEEMRLALARAHANSLKELQQAVRILDKSDRIWAIGCGASAIICQALCGIAYELGLDRFYPMTNELRYTNPVEYAEGRFEEDDGLIEYNTKLLNNNDALICISAKGHTRFVNELARRGKEKGCQVISITGKSESELARNSSCVLSLEYGEEGLVASKSQLTCLFLVHNLLLLWAWKNGIDEGKVGSQMGKELKHGKI